MDNFGNSTIQTVLNKISDYLEGRLSAEDFSYDFPVTYTLYASELDKENQELSDFIERELVNLCRCYDPFDIYEIKNKVTDENDFRTAVKKAMEIIKNNSRV